MGATFQPTLKHVHECIVRGRKYVQRGWCRGATARNTWGDSCIIGDDDVVNWSVPGSFDRAALDIAQWPSPGVRALSNSACIVFSASNDISTVNETCAANAIFVWQDARDRTKSEILDAFDRALQSLENELYGLNLGLGSPKAA